MAANKKSAKKKIVKKPAAKKKAPAAKAKKVGAPRPKLALVPTNWKNFFTPLDDRLLVQIEPPTKSKSGLILLESAEEKSNWGKVIAVGRGRQDKKGKILPMQVKVGERVWFDPHAGQVITLQSQELLVLRESDVLGVDVK